MASQNLRVNQIVTYDYANEIGDFGTGTWKVVGKEETPHSIVAPSWAPKDFLYEIRNQKSGYVLRGIRRKDLNTKKDKHFAEFL